MTRRLLPALLWASVAFALNIKGVQAKNAVWKPADNPIVITGHVEVPETVTLRIDPGAVVKFDGYFRILVRGRLEANGAAGNQVEFTSNKANPAVDDWEGIIFYGEKSKGYLTFCKIRYCFKNMIWKASPIIQNCSFSQNNYAVYCSFSKAVKILDNQIINNNFGVYCDYSSPIIQKNKIMNNGYGIYCILSSAPVVGENEIASNREKNIYIDESMGKNDVQNINNHVWDLMKGLF